MEMLDTADDVLAVRISHRITGDDLDRVMDRLDEAMARHEKVHVFVETQAIDGIELQGLGAYMARAMPLLGKLNRFGRVAVVADQAWIRAATRVESAILPFISYEVFEPQDRDRALAWVTGADA
ncbi:STAS/SEC14 domain-containing protein [Sphingopyxis sp.]|uniref:STAS/SEC14 domain-containing protein n=1 Tax=Sphingopyxis sp. TaxID=1908224 RepID=UPI002D795D06|nr:STAS/SEC14 domain-containing protein [Sphingopyxis sp.]HET6524739.1 STAS/SEC14 domain-containing protein [Sphingopyxis sp.]